MCKEILIDVHEMQPPEPMDVVMKGLDNLNQGEYIKMIHRMQPHPLYDVLLDNGFRYKVTNGEYGFDIYIWFAKDKKTGEFVKSQI
ncbi:MAG: DUF2249 domain-containing protein [Gammaproteobacteria bacterium]|nr:DUF2249 domain-containing protein [Gammaproteobacteria bacterium]